MKTLNILKALNKAAVVVLVLSFATLLSCATSGGHTHARAEGHGHDGAEGAHGGASTYALNEGVQELTTSYAALWSSDSITVKAGIPVKWYVEAAPGSLPKSGMACGKTIKIPGLGWGTDSYNENEGHLTLAEGKNLVYEFTPDKAGDILFTCWMGSECHSNYIHVTTGDVHVSDAGQSGETRGIVFRRVYDAAKPQS
jgi:hypothetical protein